MIARFLAKEHILKVTGNLDYRIILEGNANDYFIQLNSEIF